jgi:hypothetical protein
MSFESFFLLAFAVITTSLFAIAARKAVWISEGVPVNSLTINFVLSVITVPPLLANQTTSISG